MEDYEERGFGITAIGVSFDGVTNVSKLSFTMQFHGGVTYGVLSGVTLPINMAITFDRNHQYNDSRDVTWTITTPRVPTYWSWGTETLVITDYIRIHNP